MISLDEKANGFQIRQNVVENGGDDGPLVACLSIDWKVADQGDKKELLRLNHSGLGLERPRAHATAICMDCVKRATMALHISFLLYPALLARPPTPSSHPQKQKKRSFASAQRALRSVSHLSRQAKRAEPSKNGERLMESQSCTLGCSSPAVILSWIFLVYWKLFG